MIGSSDGQQYEDALDLRLGKPVEEQTAENVPLPKPRKPRPDDPGPADTPAVPETGRFGKYIWAELREDPSTFKGTYKEGTPDFEADSFEEIGKHPNAQDWISIENGHPTKGPGGPFGVKFKRQEPLTSENEPEINRDHNVKSGSVASKDSDTVYIDPSIPDKFAPFLAVHETVEKKLMAEGMSYNKAHIQATLAERQKVEEDGNMSWKTYTDEIDPYVAKAEKGDGKNPPPDPHVNIEDSIGHHADKAKTLEKADYKIASDADERPQAGQKYAMEDRVRRTPEDLQGPGRPTEGGVSKMKLKEVPMDETAKELSPSSRLFNLDVEGKPVGNMTLTPRIVEGKQLIHVDYVHGFKPGATVTERAQAAVEFKKALQKEFPEAVGVYGMRISGAKANSADPYQYVPLKDEYSGKMLKELAGKYTHTSFPPGWSSERMQAATARSSDATERALQEIYRILREPPRGGGGMLDEPGFRPIRPPSVRTPEAAREPVNMQDLVRRLEALEANAPSSTMRNIGGSIKEGAKGAAAVATGGLLLDPGMLGEKTESDEQEALRRGGDLDVRRK